MIKLKQLHLGMLAVLTAMMMTGCHWNEDPVRQSLNVEASDLVLTVGQSVSRPASSESKVSNFVYTSSKPSVALVDQNGTVTGLSSGDAVITVHMDETREGWYAAADRTYKVTVKNPTAGDVQTADKNTPLTLVAQADGKITVAFNNGITLSSDITYSVNGGAEQTISKSTEGAYDITVKKGDVVQLYSTNTALSSGVTGARGMTRAVADGAKYVNIKPSMNTEIYGNLMSLLKGKSNFASATAIEANYAFYGLFAGADKLVNNIIRHPELPATTLKEGCYEDMFYGCKGITRAPDLPAGVLTKNCYKEMFADCSKLSYVKCLAGDISPEGCTKDWLTNAGSEASSNKKVASAIKLPSGNDGLPSGWSNTLLYPVKSVTLDKYEALLGWGYNQTDTETLTAKVNPDYASEKTVSWSSSDNTIATVSSSGVVKALKEGNVNITATAGGKSATCVVTVLSVGKVTDLSTIDGNYRVEENNEELTGTLGRNCKISIKDGVTAILVDVEINGTNNSDWAGINCEGDATIILAHSNEVKGFNKRYPGIHVPTGNTLTIKGGGRLKAMSNGEGAGIGGGNGIACGNIVIESGYIEAIGGSNAAGIGSGQGANCGTITIKSDVAELIAKKGDGAERSIGAGNRGTSGTVTIGDYSEDNYISTTNGITTSPYGYPSLDLSTLTGSEYVVKETERLTGTLGTNLQISVADATTLILEDVDINGKGAWTTGNYAGINCLGDAKIILEGENTVKGFYERYPGIHIPVKNTLTIEEGVLGGELTVSSNGRSAGIGAGSGVSCGNITIEGGSIIATGGTNAAGIGAAREHDCGTITIKDGTITATGGFGAAGIGGGCGGDPDAIIISGGVVIANGGENAAAIGSGSTWLSGCKDITIYNTVDMIIATKHEKTPAATSSIGAGFGAKLNGTVKVGDDVGEITESPFVYTGEY